MKKVFKYELPVAGGPKSIMMPRSAQTLHVGHQGDPNTVCIWALVDLDEPVKMAREFYVVGTGHDIPEPARWQHIGTVVYPIPLVWHVFQETPL